MSLKIRSWNVNGLGGPEVWGDIATGDVDVALLQECRRPPVDFDGGVVPDRDGEWRTAGWAERPPWDRRTAIVARAGRRVPSDGSESDRATADSALRPVWRATLTRHYPAVLGNCRCEPPKRAHVAKAERQERPRCRQGEN